MFKKKAQAAMEFLMTYGWAILVVLVAIGALAYFGVLSPDKFLPERCTGPAGMDCVDKAFVSSSGGNLTFALKNNQGFRINISGTPSGSDDCTALGTTTWLYIANSTNELMVETRRVTSPGGIVVPNNQQFLVTADCASSLPEGRFKTDIAIPYKNVDTGIFHKATVSITGISQ